QIATAPVGAVEVELANVMVGGREEVDAVLVVEGLLITDEGARRSDHVGDTALNAQVVERPTGVIEHELENLPAGSDEIHVLLAVAGGREGAERARLLRIGRLGCGGQVVPMPSGVVP